MNFKLDFPVSFISVQKKKQKPHTHTHMHVEIKNRLAYTQLISAYIHAFNRSVKRLKISYDFCFCFCVGVFPTIF